MAIDKIRIPIPIFVSPFFRISKSAGVLPSKIILPFCIIAIFCILCGLWFSRESIFQVFGLDVFFCVWLKWGEKSNIYNVLQSHRSCNVNLLSSHWIEVLNVEIVQIFTASNFRNIMLWFLSIAIYIWSIHFRISFLQPSNITVDDDIDSCNAQFFLFHLIFNHLVLRSLLSCWSGGCIRPIFFRKFKKTWATISIANFDRYTTFTLLLLLSLL